MEKTKATIAAAAAAIIGHLSLPKPGPPGVSRATPAPRHAPAITSEERGRMNSSTRLGIKAVGSARAMAAGR